MISLVSLSSSSKDSISGIFQLINNYENILFDGGYKDKTLTFTKEKYHLLKIVSKPDYLTM